VAAIVLQLEKKTGVICRAAAPTDRAAPQGVARRWPRPFLPHARSTHDAQKAPFSREAFSIIDFVGFYLHTMQQKKEKTSVTK
jgi:hypothetical protein